MPLSTPYSAGITLPTSAVEREPSIYHLAAPPICKEVPDFEPVLPPPAFLPFSCPHDLLLGISLGAHLEEVIRCLRPVPTPPALSSGPVLRLVEVLPRDAVTYLQLLKPRGEPLGAIGNRTVRLLPARRPVFLPGGPATSPPPSLPLLLQVLPLEVREESGEQHHAPPPGPTILTISPHRRLAPSPQA